MPEAPVEERKPIAAHTRRIAQRDGAESGEELPFFDESKVPVADHHPGACRRAEACRPISTRSSARRSPTGSPSARAATMMLKFRRPVVKIKSQRTDPLPCPHPPGVLEGSRADVSFAAGLLIDKFAWHLPLYRQHQRLAAAGIRVSRPWLTQFAQAVISLLTPIYEAQFASIRSSRVKAMDETPIKAGRAGPRQDAHRLLLADLRRAR